MLTDIRGRREWAVSPLKPEPIVSENIDFEPLDFEKINLEQNNFEIPFKPLGLTEVSEFVARDAELGCMAEVLQGEPGRRTVVVHGLGGIGKTQLAIAYANRHSEYYTAVLWLNAKDQGVLRQSFTRAAQWISRHHPTLTYMSSAVHSHDSYQTMAAVKRWLDEPANNRWMVVCDSYDYPLVNGRQVADTGSKAFDLRTYLPWSNHGAIVVTTRSSMVDLGQNILLGKLDNVDDCLKILAPTSDLGDLKQGNQFFRNLLPYTWLITQKKTQQLLILRMS